MKRYGYDARFTNSLFVKKPNTKPTYRIRNWSQYTKALTNRGSLSLWIDPAAAKHWTSPTMTGMPGRPTLYHNVAILTTLTLASVFRFPLRQTIGFLRSILSLMKLDVPLAAGKRNANTESLHVVVDSTSLKAYGEGEWKVRQHGYSKRRTWRKLHLAVNESTGEILAEELTENRVHDGTVLLSL